jgi:DNA-binding NarL/FixJ family response regulator
MEHVRVLPVDHHPISRIGIRFALSAVADIEVVAETGSGREALKLIELHKPDLVLLDPNLPDLSGIEVVRYLKRFGSQASVLIFTSEVDAECVHDALEAGVAGYLTKDIPLEILIEAVRGVARGERGWVSRRVVDKMSQMWRDASHTLTPREWEVLLLIVAAKTNFEISRELSISSRTVEKYVGSILSKLGAISRVDVAVHMARLGVLKGHDSHAE